LAAARWEGVNGAGRRLVLEAARTGRRAVLRALAGRLADDFLAADDDFLAADLAADFLAVGRFAADRAAVDRPFERDVPDLAGARFFAAGLVARARAVAADFAGVMRPPRGASVMLAQRGEAP